MDQKKILATVRGNPLGPALFSNLRSGCGEISSLSPSQAAELCSSSVQAAITGQGLFTDCGQMVGKSDCDLKAVGMIV
jgi:hypothetical protein